MEVMSPEDVTFYESQSRLLVISIISPEICMLEVKYIRNFTTAFFTYPNVNISEFNFFSFMDIHVIFYKKQLPVNFKQNNWSKMCYI
jgi:hypothetical protein